MDGSHRHRGHLALKTRQVDYLQHLKSSIMSIDRMEFQSLFLHSCVIYVIKIVRDRIIVLSEPLTPKLL